MGISQVLKSETQVIVDCYSARRHLNQFSQSVGSLPGPALEVQNQTLDFLGGQIMRIEGGSGLDVMLRFREVPAFEVCDS